MWSLGQQHQVHLETCNEYAFSRYTKPENRMVGAAISFTSSAGDSSVHWSLRTTGKRESHNSDLQIRRKLPREGYTWAEEVITQGKLFQAEEGCLCNIRKWKRTQVTVARVAASALDVLTENLKFTKPCGGGGCHDYPDDGTTEERI